MGEFRPGMHQQVAAAHGLQGKIEEEAVSFRMLFNLRFDTN